MHIESEKKGKILIHNVKAMTMIDECLGWLEIIRMCGEGSRTALEMSQILDREWFCRYSCPNKIIHDNSSEFNGQEFQEMLVNYRVKS